MNPPTTNPEKVQAIEVPRNTLPVVAIVGRPNVGKSSLVNRIIGQRQAIVDDQPGVTRDRAYYRAEWCDRPFMLLDTGGMVPDPQTPMETLVNAQVNFALEEADVVVWVVDGRDGLTVTDEFMATLLRKGLKPNQPLVLSVNKVDTPAHELLLAEFYGLGLGEPIATSAIHGYGGIGNLLDAVSSHFPEALWPDSDDDQAAAASDIDDADEEDDWESRLEADDAFDDLDLDADEDDDATPATPLAKPATQVPETLPTIKLALVGRPNVGKSSLLNALVGDAHRSIVSAEAGTTRDKVESELIYHGQHYVVIDTAGIRKKSKVPFGVELFSVDRSLQAISEADVTALVIDAAEGLTDQDKRIIEFSNKKGNGLVLVVNKWDTVPNKHSNSTKDYFETLLPDMPHGRYAKHVFTSATEGQRVPMILTKVQEAYTNGARRVKTNLLNQVIHEAAILTPPPPQKNKRLNILFATQVETNPPTFLIFVNDKNLVTDSYKRYLERKIRDSVEFSGTPLRIAFKSREKGSKRPGGG